MKPIKLKTFYKKCIYSNHGIKVYQNWFYRWLTFDSRPIQSLINRKQPWRHILNYLPPMLLCASEWPGKTCLMGLGGASIIHSLNQNNHQDVIDVCELSQEVIDVSERFFYLKRYKNVNLLKADAAEFIQNNQTRYQHILVDLFDDQSFPEHCNNSIFFQHCYESLTEDGVLTINIANPVQHKTILGYLQEYFDQQIISIPIEHSTNFVLIAFKERQFDEILNLFYKNFKIKMQEWDPEFGYIIII